MPLWRQRVGPRWIRAATFSIVAMEITTQSADLEYVLCGFGGGWGWRGFGAGGFGEATTTTDTYKVARWSSICSSRRRRSSYGEALRATRCPTTSNKNIKNLDKGVEKMFKKFPPDASKK